MNEHTVCGSGREKDTNQFTLLKDLTTLWKPCSVGSKDRVDGFKKFTENAQW